jgi:thymidylate synthase
MNQFDTIYQNAIRRILNEGIEEKNERTGLKVKAVPGLTFQLNFGFPILTLRKIPVKLFIAEQIWFLTGSKNPDDFMSKYSTIWDEFREADGNVAAAYGDRWRHHFGRDQITDLVKMLEKDPSSRHGVVVTWDPADDGLGSGTKKKNVPCPYTFTVGIIGRKLHMHNIIRSNDMMLGCPHDVAGFVLLQYLLAARLGVKPGVYTHSVSNAHIYENHYEQAHEILERSSDHPPIIFQPEADYLDRAMAGDHTLVDVIFKTLNEQYLPLDRVKQMKIAL